MLPDVRRVAVVFRALVDFFRAGAVFLLAVARFRAGALVLRAGAVFRAVVLRAVVLRAGVLVLRAVVLRAGVLVFLADAVFFCAELVCFRGGAVFFCAELVCFRGEDVLFRGEDVFCSVPAVELSLSSDASRRLRREPCSRADGRRLDELVPRVSLESRSRRSRCSRRRPVCWSSLGPRRRDDRSRSRLDLLSSSGSLTTSESRISPRQEPVSSPRTMTKCRKFLRSSRARRPCARHRLPVFSITPLG